MISIEYILFSGSTLGLLLAFFLLNKNENVVVNRLLGITLLAYSIDILYALYTVTNLYLEYPFFIGISGPLPFIYSPSLYLYAHLISENKKNFSIKYLYHYIPAGLILFSGIIGYFIFTDEAKLSVMDPYVEKSLFIIVMRTIIPVYGVIYLFFSLLEIKKYHHRLKENFSDIEKLKLGWLIYLIIGIALIWILELVQIILIDVLNKPENIAYKFIYAAVSVLIYFVAYRSLKQPEVFSELELKEKDEIPSNESEISSYKKSGLTDTDLQRFTESLLELMDKDKPYLDSDLSLADLSIKLGISSHNLSEVINTKLNKSFYDFINFYRVEEVKKMLMDKKLTGSSILSIAFEAGFNSKSSFNNIFKKVTGVTPTVFRRSKNS
ncbi:MAG: AraC family transcriptional regulator [Ignavibacteriales bacterium]|nr:MAG: AraC family transcriptional regulator [Ignavibacteriales bacterium]